MRLEVRQPILSNADLEKIRNIDSQVKSFRSTTLDICFGVSEGTDGMAKALDKLSKKAKQAVDEGYNIIIISDRQVSAENVAIPALLATSAIHHFLIREGLRTETGLIVETGEAKQVHDFCLLAGYGAEAINPYLAFETIAEYHSEISEVTALSDAYMNYIKAVDKGILKVLSKMGISTSVSYTHLTLPTKA